jgi:methylated-DNA-protein-cysteine methyltransferase-like protein
MTNYSRTGNQPGKPAYRTPSRFARETVGQVKAYTLRQKYSGKVADEYRFRKASGGSGFFKQVYEMVKRIPRGKVSTYGAVAKMIGTRDARKIGWALHGNNDAKVPCHRVVNKNGELASNYAFEGGWKEQKRRLLTEGITFVSETRVNLKKHFWQDR